MENKNFESKNDQTKLNNILFSVITKASENHGEKGSCLGLEYNSSRQNRSKEKCEPGNSAKPRKISKVKIKIILTRKPK